MDRERRPIEDWTDRELLDHLAARPGEEPDDRMEVHPDDTDSLEAEVKQEIAQRGIGARPRRVNPSPNGKGVRMARYEVNPDAVAKAEQLIDARQYVLDSDWGEAQPSAANENAFLQNHSWAEYAAWHLGLTVGAGDETKARHAFVFGDFRRLHRTALIACVYRASEWRHKEIELAAHDLLQRLDSIGD